MRFYISGMIIMSYSAIGNRNISIYAHTYNYVYINIYIIIYIYTYIHIYICTYVPTNIYSAAYKNVTSGAN